jgi:hypothetical protein
MFLACWWFEPLTVVGVSGVLTLPLRIVANICNKLLHLKEDTANFSSHTQKDETA